MYICISGAINNCHMMIKWLNTVRIYEEKVLKVHLRLITLVLIPAETHRISGIDVGCSYRGKNKIMLYCA